MTRRLVILAGALALSLSLGCGNKGPLYLPQAETATPADAAAEAGE